MTTYNTGNPLGSSAAKDLYDNAQNFDNFINNRGVAVYADRFGVQRRTWFGMQSQLEGIITSLDTANFTFQSESAGIAGTSNGQYFRVPEGPNSSSAFTYYRNTNGSAVAVARTPGKAAVDEITSNFKQVGMGPYFAISDASGRIGKGLYGYYVKNRFGAGGNEVSDDGLTTSAVKLSESGFDGNKLSVQAFIGDSLICDYFGRAKKIGESGSNPVYNDKVQLLEPGSIDLFVFGGENFRTGLVNGTLIREQGNCILRQQSAGLVAVNGSIVTSIADSAEYTYSFVVQLPYMNNTTDRVMLYTFTSSTQAAGIRCWFDKNANGDFTISAMRNDANTPRVGVALPSNVKPGDWIFISHVVKLNNAGENYQVMYIGGSTFKKCYEFDTVTKTLSTRTLGVGNPYFDLASYKLHVLNIAEFTAFNYALSAEEMNEHFKRSNFRMNLRGITLRTGV